ncbi:PAS domain-containing sensor histidine kinase [Motiliproteus sp. SC1-56]|uniref:sensor histidine kinase n=1 Tax=Motiliproteus sp. SC1-56 TaxID=2799565 RepID=UPI001F5D5C02|nr:ATP-binding protein [Motiliproteus sp. SC1-56]
MARDQDKPGSVQSPEALQQAFEAFTEMSEQLASSYADLEARVEQLSAELASTNEQRERELAEKEQVTRRLESLLELLPGGVVVLDNRGRVHDCNPAAEELLGKPLLEQPWIEVIQRSFAPREDDGHEVSLQDGRRVSLATRSLTGEPGQIILITDHTETRELQAKVSHFQRLSSMGKMMASIAHQIRTPLSAAMLYSSHLTRPVLTDEQRIRFAAKVKSRLSSLEEQIRDMLIFARGETKLTDFISSEELFTAIDAALDVPLARADADCDCVNQTPGVWLQCNREALVGALMNLVNNALQAGAGDKGLVVRSRPLDDKMLLLSVEDQGPGMDAALLAKVQEPFYTTRPQGTGLGLAVAQVAARAHHGELVIESTPGKGTQAGFKLPYRKTETEQTHD